MERLQSLLDELQDTLSRETFERFESPEELHYLALNFPWETKEEIQIIRWICESDICSQATALMLFWLAQPQDYTACKLDTKIPYHNDIFEIIQIILKKFKSGKYKNHNIHYDPRGDMPDDAVEIDERMKLSVSGEETWYDEEYIKEISRYFPGELESEINRCDSMDYLNMIANGLTYFKFKDAPGIGGLIINNSCCDKGTALLLYWRLLLFYFNWGFSPKESEERIPVIKQIRENLLSGLFNEGIAYDPMKDRKNAKLLGKQKNKWQIPECMKRPV